MCWLGIAAVVAAAGVTPPAITRTDLQRHDLSAGPDRRTFCGGAAATLAASQLGVSSIAAEAATFAALKRITADPLDVSYAEAGPAAGEPVIRLHRWPYDIHAFEAVASILVAKCGLS